MADKGFEITKDITNEINAANRERALQSYADNVPYDKDRVIREGKFFLRHIAAAKFELGKRLLILKEFESVQTFALIVQDEFGGMSRRSVFHYMAFAKKCMDLPKLKAYGEENWSKVLTLLNSCTDEQLKEIEKNGIDGKVLDEYDGFSVREFKTLLKQYKKDAEKAIGKQIAKLEERNNAITIENRILRAQIDRQTPKQIGESIKAVEKSINTAIDIIANLDLSASVNGNKSLRRKLQSRTKKLQKQVDVLMESI